MLIQLSLYTSSCNKLKESELCLLTISHCILAVPDTVLGYVIIFFNKDFKVLTGH